MLFEEFGLSYFGPIDGHNLPLLIETFKFLKHAEQTRGAARDYAEGPWVSAGDYGAEEVSRAGWV